LRRHQIGLGRYALKKSRLQLGLAFFGFVLIGANGGTTGVLLPSMSSYYRVDNSVIGLLFLAGSLGYFLSAFSSSLFIERLGMRGFLLLGSFTFLLGMLTLAVKPPFIVILATRLLLGYGIAILETGLNAYVVALPRHTTQLNSLHAFYGAGALLGPILAGALLAFHWAWNSVYFVWGALSLPLLLGFATLYAARLPPESRHKEEGGRRGNDLLATLKLPAIWWATLFLLLYVGVEVSLGNWTYTFLALGRHQQALFSSLVVSGYWLGLTLGRFTLASFAERLRLGNAGLIYCCMAAILLGVTIIWLLPSPFFAAAGFCFVGFSLGPIYPTTVALVPSLVPARLVASAIGFLVSLSILGLAFFPWLAGILTQGIGSWSILPYSGLLTALMLCFWWLMFRGGTRWEQPYSSSSERSLDFTAKEPR
jgi:fucose permease